MSLETGTEPRRRAVWPQVAAGAVLALVLANVLAIGAVTAAPERCASCHVEPAGSLEVRSGHASAACLDCHGGTTAVETVDFAGRQLWGMYLRVPPPNDRSVAVVSDAACISCHDMSGDLPERAAIRIDHVECTADRSCTSCHSRVAHGDSIAWAREYDMFECVPCHMAAAQSVQCDLCHTERSRQERVQTGSFALTHDENWQRTHGMGDSLACAACHPADKCSGCHGAGVPHGAAFATRHGSFALETTAQCASCHTQRFCDDCHLIEMPHPTGFIAEHSDVVGVDGSTTCENCHAPSDCETCHVKHVHPGNARQGGGGS